LSGLVPVANAIAGRYIVVLKQKPEAPLRSLLHATEMGVQDVKTTSRGYAATIAAQALQRILADPNVAYVQEDGIKSVKPLAGTAATWGLDRIDQRDLPLDGNYVPGADGAQINVAIVDTGISSHPDFEDRLQQDCFTAHGAVCADSHGHGTHVSGTVGGKTWGVAKKARLWAVRVLDAQGSGSDSDVIRGIEWVSNKANSDPLQKWVINMSLGGSPAPALDQATCSAIAAGVVVVVAAGNESQDASRSSPARVKQAITVGATDRADRQANFSNYGVLLDLYGPGVDVQSTIPGGGTDSYSGTSMASPHVAGGAALFLSRHLGSSPQDVRDGLVLYASKDKLSGLGAGSPNALLYTKEE
jgi:subtilisin family serine protease